MIAIVLVFLSFAVITDNSSNSPVIEPPGSILSMHRCPLLPTPSPPAPCPSGPLFLRPRIGLSCSPMRSGRMVNNHEETCQFIVGFAKHQNLPIIFFIRAHAPPRSFQKSERTVQNLGYQTKKKTGNDCMRKLLSN